MRLHFGTNVYSLRLEVAGSELATNIAMQRFLRGQAHCSSVCTIVADANLSDLAREISEDVVLLVTLGLRLIRNFFTGLERILIFSVSLELRCVDCGPAD